MTGISIGQYINEKLGGSEELAALIGEKIFPISTQKEVDSPFIVYQRASLTPNYTKDLVGDDAIQVAFVVASDKYVQSVEVAEALRNALEGKRANKYGITEIRLISADEDLLEGTFIQILVFSFKMDINN